MNKKILTKDQAILFLAAKLDCSTEDLLFLFRPHGVERNYSETLIIPEQRLSN